MPKLTLSSQSETTNLAIQLNLAVLEFLNNLWGARNQVRIGLSYRPARLQQPGGISTLESILGLLKV